MKTVGQSKKSVCHIFNQFNAFWVLLCILFNILAYFYSHFSVNCQWASWGSWQSCSRSCGGGTQKRYRTKSVVAQNGGNECSGSNTDTQSCNTNNCPGTYKTHTNYTKQDFLIHLYHFHFSVNCMWASWGSWTNGQFKKKRHRSKSVVAQNGGNECSGSFEETRPRCETPISYHYPVYCRLENIIKGPCC